jgi:hypothetical protein
VIWQCGLEGIKMFPLFHLVILLLEVYSKEITQKKENEKGDWFYYLYWRRTKDPGKQL